jgi:hypothetical protein
MRRYRFGVVETTTGTRNHRGAGFPLRAPASIEGGRPISMAAD